MRPPRNARSRATAPVFASEALAASVQAGLEAADVHAYTEAGVHFERALELWDASVDRVDLLARTAQAARFAGDPERAVALCREAIELTDDPARKALLYERLGEYHFWDDEAALECYRHALELLPGEPRLLAAEGHALFGLRRWEDARERCEAALEAGAGPRITLGRGAGLPRRAGRRRGAPAARAGTRRERRGDRACLHAPRRAPSRARRSRGGARGDGRRRARGGAARAARLVRAFHVRQRAPTTCCGSGAGTRRRPGSPRPSGSTCRGPPRRCGEASPGCSELPRRRRGGATRTRRAADDGLPSEFLAPLGGARADAGDVRRRPRRGARAPGRRVGRRPGSALHAAAVFARAAGGGGRRRPRPCAPARAGHGARRRAR